ncbi:hypothetical protein GOP47_0020339 [Adiantum capillus-veneris]|uniref:Cysteine proteinase inhibitor n=1 Tax=Adiantum capillus-veneris TaxID=13818 RepID=A0A9D4UCT8_ADICA|nr:hypothetical protein GOP47_0019844 [Adiantum capillus-veneris]KAI5065644.1 hypothetical protein GOP47_0020339 [Adiantum capillus-veneris]
MEMPRAMLGGTAEVKHHDRPEVAELARYAVDEHNSRQNAKLSFVRLVSAKTQVVAGVLYHMVVEAESEGRKNLYEAKVWEKAWENFKSLESFVPHHAGHTCPIKQGKIVL